jgi:hypothetical protein
MFLRNVSNFYQTAQRHVPVDSTLNLLFCYLAYTFTLKMETVRFSETSVSSTRLHGGTSQTLARYDFWLLGCSSVLKMEAVLSSKTLVNFCSVALFYSPVSCSFSLSD